VLTLKSTNQHIFKKYKPSETMAFFFCSNLGALFKNSICP
jgi:hypothetical protein